MDWAKPCRFLIGSIWPTVFIFIIVFRLSLPSPSALCSAESRKNMKPRVFIGSSTEGLSIANAIQQNLDHDADCTVWTQGVFSVSSYPVDALVNVVRQNDFSIFVFSPDDLTRIRSNQHVTVRDNVIFETGLFMGRYGKERSFIVAPRGVPDLHIPTDLIGLKLADYDQDAVSSNPQAGIGAACTCIRTAIAAHPVMTTRLTFAISAQRSVVWPLVLAIEIRNTTSFSALITSRHFQVGRSLRPDMKNAKGNPASNEYEIKFASPDGRWLNQFHVLVHPNDTTSTWFPFDPSHTDQEVQTAIGSATCGEWNYDTENNIREMPSFLDKHMPNNVLSADRKKPYPLKSGEK